MFKLGSMNGLVDWSFRIGDIGPSRPTVAHPFVSSRTKVFKLGRIVKGFALYRTISQSLQHTVP